MGNPGKPSAEEGNFDAGSRRVVPGHCMTQDGQARFASSVLMGAVRWKQEADGSQGTSQK